MAKEKLNLTLDKEIKEKLIKEAKKKGLSISGLITVWVNEVK